MPPESGKSYTRRDLLSIATRLESNMADFYIALAKQYSEKGELLTAFADEEAEHIALVHALGENPGECSEGEKSRIAEIMDSFENGGFLPEPAYIEGKLRATRSIGEAMRFSSELERRVELFYCLIAPSFESEAKKRLYELIVAEHKHRIQVEEMTELAGEGDD